MKKSTAATLKRIASHLPDKWEKDYETVTMTGAEANLCYIGSKRPFRKDQIVEFQSPRFVKINHHKRLKEGVKKHGTKFIGQYIARF